MGLCLFFVAGRVGRPLFRFVEAHALVWQAFLRESLHPAKGIHGVIVVSQVIDRQWVISRVSFRLGRWVCRLESCFGLVCDLDLLAVAHAGSGHIFQVQESQLRHGVGMLSSFF